MCREGNLLFDRTVNGEGTGDNQREERYNLCYGNHVNEADDGKEKGHFFPSAQPFLKGYHADEGNDDRFDKITKAGVENMAAVNGIDVNAPIDGNEDAAKKTYSQISFVLQEILQFPGFPAENDKNPHKHHGPYNSLGKNINGGNFAEEVPKKR